MIFKVPSNWNHSMILWVSDSGKLLRVEEDNQEVQCWTEKAVRGELCSAGLHLELSLKTSETQRLTELSNLRANWPMSVPRESFLIPRNLILRSGEQLSAAFLTPLPLSFVVFNLFTCPQRYRKADVSFQSRWIRPLAVSEAALQTAAAGRARSCQPCSLETSS